VKRFIRRGALALAVCGGALLCAAPRPAEAATTFHAVLTGAQEVPPRATPATGFGVVVLNDAENQIDVSLQWSGLTTPTIDAHIHGPATPTQIAGVLIPLMPPTGATSGSLFRTVAINATNVARLKQGLLYFNVHSTMFPPGEIRGQIGVVPEPGSLAMLLPGLLPLGLALRRRLKS
jgi:hypothetical protein